MNFNLIIQNHKADVFPGLTMHQRRILNLIQKCRTPDLGAHLYLCSNCKTVLLLNNSCSNRNCPVCQGNKRRQWIEKQCSNLLNVPYFHVVFTIPDVLNPLFLQHQGSCYNILYHTVWQTLKRFFETDASLRGKGGMFCILHTWGQTLNFHPHLHCLVPAAGIGKDGRFKLLKGKDKFLFNVKGMRKFFRARLAAELTVLEKNLVLQIPPIVRKLMFAKNWVIFCQRPFSNPENVVRYIGMYSHRVAIGENRIIDDSNGKTSFLYKDYRNQSQTKTMQLPSDEFLRRFAMHILPARFMKIRYYGQLNNRNKKHFLETAAAAVGKYQNATLPETDSIEKVNPVPEPDYGLDDQMTEPLKITNLKCPICRTGYLIRIGSLSATDLTHGITVINHGTAEIVYRSRDGPITENETTIKIEI